MIHKRAQLSLGLAPGSVTDFDFHPPGSAVDFNASYYVGKTFGLANMICFFKSKKKTFR